MKILKTDCQYQIGTQLFRIEKFSGAGDFFRSLSHLTSDTRSRPQFSVVIHNGNSLSMYINSIKRITVEGELGFEFSATLVYSKDAGPGGLSDKETEEVRGKIFF